MAVYGYSQVPQLVPAAPIDYTQPLSNLGSVDQSILEVQQKILQFELHSQELQRVDEIHQSTVTLTVGNTTAVEALSDNLNRITSTIFNATDGQLFVGQKSDTSSILFETRLEPGSFHMFSGEDAKQGIWVLAPSASQKLSVAIVEKLHDPSKDLYAPTTPPPAPPSFEVVPTKYVSANQSVVVAPDVLSSSANTAITFTTPAGWANKPVTYYFGDASTNKKLDTGSYTISANSVSEDNVAHQISLGAVIGGSYYYGYYDGTTYLRTPAFTISA